MLDSSILLNGLTKLSDEKKSELDIVDIFSSAWTSYFEGGALNGIPQNPKVLEGAKSAMKGAMTGIIQADKGAIAIQAGLVAFWGTIVASAVTIWTTSPNTISVVVPPTTLSGLAKILKDTFDSNTSKKLLKNDALKNIADTLHKNAGIGSSVTLTAPNGVTISTTIQ